MKVQGPLVRVLLTKMFFGQQLSRACLFLLEKKCLWSNIFWAKMPAFSLLRDLQYV